MDGPFHYREAERLIEKANDVGHRDPQRGDGILLAAQVHATLALAAATVIQPSAYAATSEEWKAWDDALEAQPEPSDVPGQVEPEPAAGDGTVSISGVAPKSIVVYSGWNDGNPVVIDSVEDLGGVVCVHYRDAEKPRYSRLPATVPSDMQVTPYGGAR